MNLIEGGFLLLGLFLLAYVCLTFGKEYRRRGKPAPVAHPETVSHAPAPDVQAPQASASTPAASPQAVSASLAEAAEAAGIRSVFAKTPARRPIWRRF